jgi:predicted RNA methylase
MGASIVWYTLILGISPMPSSKKARQAMIQLSCDTGTGPIFELGSGWGNLLIPLALEYPERKLVGYELSFLPWLTTRALKKLHGLDNIQIHRKNFLHADLSSASVICCYLVPSVMLQVENKCKAKNGKLEFLISNTFALPLHQAVTTLTLNDFYRSPVYLYKFNGPLAD